MRFKQKITAILTLVAVLLCLNSCSEKAETALSFALKQDRQYVGTGAASFHTLTSLPETAVASSGFVSMSFEPSSAAVCITELTKGNVWSVLPLFENGGASAFDIVLRKSDGVYYLNSQDNSVAYGSYEYKTTENGVTVEYLVADKAENASGKVASVTDGAAVKLTAEYVLTDGDLRVTIDCASAELSPDTVLESISLMPYFGAVKKGGDDGNELRQAVLSSAQEQAGIPDGMPSAKKETENKSEAETETKSDKEEEETTAAEQTSTEKSSPDFILVPDGSGAVMYTDFEDDATSDMTFDVYGSGKNGAKIPVFGVKKDSGAFVAVIDDGAAVSEIRARRAEKSSYGAAVVYPVFTVTEHIDDGGKYIYATPYGGKISVCYRFMSGSEANYISMAAVCREELIRNGTLSSKTLTENDYPLNISVTVSVDGTSKRTVSAFEDAEDLLQLLKAKGVENVRIMLNGMFSGGLVRESGSSLRVLRSAGGTSGLQKLCEYAVKQKFKVFAGVSLIKTAGVKNGSGATDLAGNSLKSTVKNALAPDVGQAEYSVGLISADEIENATVSLMNDAERLPVTGLAVLDADIGTYSDSSCGKNACEVSEILSKNISAFSTRKELALSGAGFNTLKTASLVTELPLSSNYTESEAYKSVPLIPAVLHSTVLYSGSPVNAGTAAQLELLKCVEYGAQPYYLWVFDGVSHYDSEQTFNEAVSFVLRASEELGDLSSCRMTAHEEIEENVFCTEYDSGARVYVNYNNYSVNIGDISVLPYDYIRIN